MSRVLIVEDSGSVAKLLRAAIAERLDVGVDIVESMAGMQEIVQVHSDYAVAVAGLYLPDALNGEVVDALNAQGIPVIVLTGAMSEEVREAVLRKRVVDYVIKQGISSIDYVASLVYRVYRNRDVKVLVVDDSDTQRRYLRALLELQQCRVTEAGDAEQALALLERDPEFSMLITDYEMPGMNGMELIQAIRRSRARDELSIIGVSGHGSSLSARLLKAGANDYLAKPFVVEEFNCRVNQNIELIEHVCAIKSAAVRDFLTGLNNRKYLYEAGGQLHGGARRGNLTLTAAMLDIDHFKKVNDTYGHHAGDLAIRHVARVLRENTRQADLVARYGGEEFCVLATNAEPGDLSAVFEKLRAAVEAQPVQADGQVIPITISIGVSSRIGESLDELLDHADKMLYQAKEGGRNRVVTDFDEDHAATA